MLTRRAFLRNTAALAVIGAARAEPWEACGLLVGHSAKCVSHVLDGCVDLKDVGVIYLAPRVMAPQVGDADYDGQMYRFLVAATFDRKPPKALSHADKEWLAEMVARKIIRTRLPEMGLVGRRIWTRDGVPYWPPGLYGAMLPQVMASYERYV